MKVITRHLTKEILQATGFVLLALVALFAFFDLIGQMGRIGSRYGLLDAFIITGLSLPMRIYEVMPIAALLGAVFVMSQWAARSEFTILRVAGLSPVRLSAILMVPGIILMIFTYAFGEFIAPPSDAYSREYRAAIEHHNMNIRGSSTGAWVREVTTAADGSREIRYINVKAMTPTQEALTWRVFDFDKDQHLTEIITADTGNYVNGQGWLLQKSVTTRFPVLADLNQTPILERIRIGSPVRMMFNTQIDPSIFSVMMLKPENMSMRGLARYVSHLEQSQQQSGRYEIALWNKAFYPIAILVMIALAMPFAYMNTRSGGVSIKIFAGVMIGLTFYTVNNLFSYIGMLNTWPPLVVAMVPTIFMLILAMIGMWYVEKR